MLESSLLVDSGINEEEILKGQADFKAEATKIQDAVFYEDGGGSFDLLRIHLDEIHRRPRPTEEENLHLISRAQQGDKSARNLVWELNSPLSIYTATRVLGFSGSTSALMDLIQAGYCRYPEIIEGFKEKKGSFASYAVRAIARAQLEERALQKSVIHVTDSTKKYHKRVQRELELPKSQLSLNYPIYNGEGDNIELEDLIPSQDGVEEGALETLHLPVLRIFLMKAFELAKLTKNQRKVLLLRYILPLGEIEGELDKKRMLVLPENRSSCNPKHMAESAIRTHEQAGISMGTTRQCIQSLDARALAKIRPFMNTPEVLNFLIKEELIDQPER